MLWFARHVKVMASSQLVVQGHGWGPTQIPVVGTDPAWAWSWKAAHFAAIAGDLVDMAWRMDWKEDWGWSLFLWSTPGHKSQLHAGPNLDSDEDRHCWRFLKKLKSFGDPGPWKQMKRRFKGPLKWPKRFFFGSGSSSSRLGELLKSSSGRSWWQAETRHWSEGCRHGFYPSSLLFFGLCWTFYLS